MAKPWFRMYRKIVDSKKLHDLKPELFKAWCFLLAITDDNGLLPPVSDIAFKLRTSTDKALAIVTQLRAARLLDVSETGDVTAHDWTDHNYESDVSTDRVKRFRERSTKRSGNDERNAPDTDTEQIQNQKEKEVERSQARAAPKAPRPSKPVSGSKPKPQRWPEGAVISDEWLKLGEAARHRHGMPRIDLRLEAEKFANYWASKSGGSAVKADWLATWTNWCISDYAGKTNGNGKSAHPFGVFGALLEKEITRGSPPAARQEADDGGGVEIIGPSERNLRPAAR